MMMPRALEIRSTRSIFYGRWIERVYVGDGVYVPETDADVPLSIAASEVIGKVISGPVIKK